MHSAQSLVPEKKSGGCPSGGLWMGGWMDLWDGYGRSRFIACTYVNMAVMDIDNGKWRGAGRRKKKREKDRSG
jgi:hypothetical protein